MLYYSLYLPILDQLIIEEAYKDKASTIVTSPYLVGLGVTEKVLREGALTLAYIPRLTSRALSSTKTTSSLIVITYYLL